MCSSVSNKFAAVNRKLNSRMRFRLDQTIRLEKQQQAAAAAAGAAAAAAAAAAGSSVSIGIGCSSDSILAARGAVLAAVTVSWQQLQWLRDRATTARGSISDRGRCGDHTTIRTKMEAAATASREAKNPQRERSFLRRLK